MHAYAVQPSTGMVKLDAMENPFELPEPMRLALGERLARVPINRYPGARTDDLIGARLQRGLRGGFSCSGSGLSHSRARHREQRCQSDDQCLMHRSDRGPVRPRGSG